MRWEAFESTISQNGHLKSERAAAPLSGTPSKRLLSVFFSSSSHLSCPFFLPGLSRCCGISPLTQESVSRVCLRPFENASHFADHLGKHLPSSSAFIIAEMKGYPAVSSGFCNQSHMLGRTASCKTSKIFVVNTSAWLCSCIPVCQCCFALWTPVEL